MNSSKIHVHCNTPRTALHDKVSTRVFDKILKKFQDMDESEQGNIHTIFQKLKWWRPIWEEEYSIFSMFLNHKDLESYLEEIKSQFLHIPEKKSNTVSFDWLRIELQSKLTSSRAIGILQQEEYRTRIVEMDGKSMLV